MTRPLPLFRIRTLMIAVSVLAAALGLIVYRDTMPSLDEHDGLWQGLVIATVDLGMMVGIPALLVLTLWLWVVRLVFSKLVAPQARDHLHPESHEPDRPSFRAVATDRRED